MFLLLLVNYFNYFVGQNTETDARIMDEKAVSC